MQQHQLVIGGGGKRREEEQVKYLLTGAARIGKWLHPFLLPFRKIVCSFKGTEIYSYLFPFTSSHNGFIRS